MVSKDGIGDYNAISLTTSSLYSLETQPQPIRDAVYAAISLERYIHIMFLQQNIIIVINIASFPTIICTCIVEAKASVCSTSYPTKEELQFIQYAVPMEQGYNKGVAPIHIRYMSNTSPVDVRYVSGQVPDIYRTSTGQQ